MASDTHMFFTDAAPAPRPYRPATESVRIARHIAELQCKKWSEPEDRNEIDEVIATLRARLAWLTAHPLEDC